MTEDQLLVSFLFCLISFAFGGMVGAGMMHRAAAQDERERQKQRAVWLMQRQEEEARMVEEQDPQCWRRDM